MTIQELYEWAKQNNAENKEIVVQYRDDGGDYEGQDSNLKLDIENNFVIL